MSRWRAIMLRGAFQEIAANLAVPGSRVLTPLEFLLHMRSMPQLPGWYGRVLRVYEIVGRPTPSLTPHDLALWEADLPHCVEAYRRSYEWVERLEAETLANALE